MDGPMVVAADDGGVARTSGVGTRLGRMDDHRLAAGRCTAMDHQTPDSPLASCATVCFGFVSESFATWPTRGIPQRTRHRDGVCGWHVGLSACIARDVVVVVGIEHRDGMGKGTRRGAFCLGCGGGFVCWGTVGLGGGHVLIGVMSDDGYDRHRCC